MVRFDDKWQPVTYTWKMIAVALLLMSVVFFVIGCDGSEAGWYCPPGCDRPATEDARVETARRIVTPNANDWDEVICWCAEDIQYSETVARLDGRQAFGDYLQANFENSSDQETVIQEEVYNTVDDEFVYTATWIMTGNYDGFPYQVPGVSFIKFRAGEGCPYYARDYFTEGDIWVNVKPVTTLIKQMREEYLRLVGLEDVCYDDDGDGYGFYACSTCPVPEERDCYDQDPAVNPGAAEVCGNGIDDNCIGQIDEGCPG